MTLEEAKQEYFKYNCSTYGMFRDGDRYEEFCALNIPLSTLNAWTQERFDTTYEKFLKTRSYSLFNRMYIYSESNHDKRNLLIMRKALHDINYETMRIKASISRTILGDKSIQQRNGMIYWAYDLGEKEIATELLRFVLHLSTENNKFKEELDIHTESMIKTNIKLCYQIDYKLQLGVLNNVTLKGLLNRQLDIIKYKYKEYKFWRK